MRTKEEQLLFEDLCERLPYKPIVYIKWSYKENKWDIKPYLRPMSSMTKEEDEEWRLYKRSIVECRDDVLEEKIAELHNWFNSKHFDWRGFIPKGLALEAPEDMYKIN